MDTPSSHTHPHLDEASRKTTARLSLSLFLTLAFVILEAGAGIFANSLALLTDAAHNLTDVIALGLTWFAVRITSQPANAQKTYGYHRAGTWLLFLTQQPWCLFRLAFFMKPINAL